MKTKSLNVQLLEALNAHYLKAEFSPNPITCKMKAAETLLMILKPNAETCAMCDNAMITERAGDELSICHACYCDLMERVN